MNKIPSIFPGFAIALGTIIIFLLGWFVISIILCIWVYRDAKQRGEEAILWLIVVLIANLIGVIIWLIVRPEKVEDIDNKEEKVTYCSHCGTEIGPGSKYCSECGEELKRI